MVATSNIVNVTDNPISDETIFTFNDKGNFLHAENILKKALNGGSDMVWLVGSDPLAHPKIFNILKALKVVNISAGVATTGLKLADFRFVASLKAAGMGLTTVAILGLSGSAYKSVCGHNHWEAVRQGLHNLVRAGVELMLDIPVFLTNLLSIQDLILLCKDLENPAIRLFYPRIVKKKAPGLYPRMDLAATAVQILAGQYEGEVFVHGIPECFPVGEAKRLYARGWHLPWEARAEKLGACSECRDRQVCFGIPKGYIGLHGVPINGPFVEPVSSSFDFVDTGNKARGTPVAGPDCFALSGPSNKNEPGKSVLIRVPNSDFGRDWGLFVTDTNDFDPKEVSSIVKDAGQLYWDGSTGTDITDFAGQLVRLGMEKACRTCRLLGQCPGCFAPVSSPAFQEEVNLIAGIISTMRGRILDVGAGEGYYRDTIREMLDAGIVGYHALDPEEKSLEKLLTALPRAMTHVGSIETTNLSVAGFDNIIAIRSVNHFKSLHHAFDNIVKMLKTGGSLVVTDGLALPLARTKDKAIQAHSLAKGGFQHYRNLSSQEFIKFLSDYPFEVVFHRPVGRNTSDEWVVHAKKTG